MSVTKLNTLEKYVTAERKQPEMEQLKPDVLANCSAEMVTCYIELMKVVLT